MTTKKKILLGLAIIIGIFWMHMLISSVKTPAVSHLKWFRPCETAYMNADDNGDIIYKWVPLSKISPYLQQAVVLAEDDTFYSHAGFDAKAMKKAARLNWKKGRFLRGGSTITMQLARNLYLSPEKSLWRKFRELLIALKLERELSKKRILELYLNVAEWGDGIYGAEAAAKHYFGKSAANLSKREAAFLAAILPRPRFFDRHRSGQYLENRIAVIEGML